MAGISLDHVGALVRDLDAGAERWRRLGFHLAARSPQMGFDRATNTATPWATANHVAVFRQGYLELIGIVAPDHPNPWARFYDRFEGIHIVAFRCADADAAYAALRERTDGLDPPIDRRRQAPFGDGVREMRFRNIFSRDDRFPEGRFIVIEHQTPEVLWQESLMRHPNGAVALREVVFCADDVAATRGRLSAVVGAAPGAGGGEAVIEAPGGGRLSVLSREGFAARFRDAAVPATPCAAAVVVAVADMARVRALLARAGLRTQKAAGGSLWVHPQDGNGAVVAFAQA